MEGRNNGGIGKIIRPQLEEREFIALLREHQLDQNPLVLKALRRSEREHAHEERDFGGRNYWTGHVLPVAAAALLAFKHNEKWARGHSLARLVSATLLHDVKEKSETRIGRIWRGWRMKMEFGSEIHDLVEPLTKGVRRKFRDPKKDLREKIDRDHLYSLEIANAPDFIKVIKFCDKLMNAQDPFGNTSEVDINKIRYLRRTLKEWKVLAEVLEENTSKKIFVPQMEKAEEILRRMEDGEKFAEGAHEFRFPGYTRPAIAQE